MELANEVKSDRDDQILDYLIHMRKVESKFEHNTNQWQIFDFRIEIVR